MPDKLLEMELPAGEVLLELEFVRPLWRTLIPLVSAGSIVILFGLLLRNNRR